MRKLKKQKHSSLKKGQAAKKAGLPFQRLYPYLLAVFIGYMGADLFVISLRPKMLPEEAPPARPTSRQTHRPTSLADYRVITKRNLFNEDGVIPPALAREGEDDVDESPTGSATLTSLPLELKGTIVHRNPKKSVATIISKNRGNANVTSFRVKDQIKGMAQIFSIQRRKVVFKNLNNGRTEYVEMPEESKVSIGYKNTTPSTNSDQEVVQTSDTDFQIKRSDLKKYISNASEILRQARMVPNIVPGSDGQVEGFRFVSIQPNSIYSKLGLKVNDTIKAVNGQPVNSPSKAMELYNALKTASQVKITLERNGSTQENNYSITD